MSKPEDAVNQALAATNPIVPTEVAGPTPPEDKKKPTSPWDLFSGMFDFFGNEKKKEGEDAAKKPDATAGADSLAGAAAASSPPTNGSQVIQYPPSPINRQTRSDKGQPAAEPLTIVFLNGKFKGKKLNLKPSEESFLGVAVPEANYEQTAEWKDQDNNSIRAGQTFSGISSRTIKYSLTFYDPNHDVSHLVEQLFFMQEISDRKGDVGEGGKKKDTTGLDNTPPALYIQQGDVILAPCVCTSLSAKYDYPISGEKGYRHAVVDVGFKLLGGRGSPNMLAAPLTSTPLGESIQDQTVEERRQEGLADLTKLLLGSCLGEEGKAKLSEMLGDNAAGLNDKKKLLELDANTLVNLAVGGVIPEKIYNDEAVQERLKNDVAKLMARAENGGIGFSERIMAEALKSGKPEGLDPRWQPVYKEMKRDYDIIADAVKSNKLDKSSEIFSDANRSTTNRFTTMANCGLRLRDSGGANVAQTVEANEANTLKLLNDSIKSKSDKELKEMFDLKSESQVRHLKSGAPYQSEQQLLDYFAQDGNGISGYSIWGKAVEAEKKKQEEEEEKKKKPQS